MINSYVNISDYDRYIKDTYKLSIRCIERFNRDKDKYDKIVFAHLHNEDSKRSWILHLCTPELQTVLEETWDDEKYEKTDSEKSLITHLKRRKWDVERFLGLINTNLYEMLKHYSYDLHRDDLPYQIFQNCQPSD